MILLNYIVGYLFLYPRIFGYLLIFVPRGLLEQMSFVFENLIYLFVFVSTVVLAWPMLKEDLMKLRKKKLKFAMGVGKRYIQMYLVMLVTNMLVMIVSGIESSANQQEVLNQMALHPVQIMLISSVFAPVCEEIVFRGVIFKKLDRESGFIAASLVSAVLFGLLHVYVSLLRGNWLDLVFIVVYGSMGWVLCRAVQDHDSIYSSILVHSLNNFLACLLMIL